MLLNTDLGQRRAPCTWWSIFWTLSSMTLAEMCNSNILSFWCHWVIDHSKLSICARDKIALLMKCREDILMKYRDVVIAKMRNMDIQLGSCTWVVTSHWLTRLACTLNVLPHAWTFTSPRPVDSPISSAMTRSAGISLFPHHQPRVWGSFITGCRVGWLRREVTQGSGHPMKAVFFLSTAACSKWRLLPPDLDKFESDISLTSLWQKKFQKNKSCMKELAVCNTPFEMIDLISWWQTNSQLFDFIIY